MMTYSWYVVIFVLILVNTLDHQQPNLLIQSLLGEDRMIVGFICFICGFVVGFITLDNVGTTLVQVSVLVAVFYRDIDLVAKKAGRKQYFIVTR